MPLFTRQKQIYPENMVIKGEKDGGGINRSIGLYTHYYTASNIHTTLWSMK